MTVWLIDPDAEAFVPVTVCVPAAKNCTLLVVTTSGAGVGVPVGGGGAGASVTLVKVVVEVTSPRSFPPASLPEAVNVAELFATTVGAVVVMIQIAAGTYRFTCPWAATASAGRR